MSNRLREQLTSAGYAVVRTETLEGFETRCKTLGKITQTLQVRIEESGGNYPNRPNRVPFHTDHPHIPYVAWHCLAQDDTAGENLLVDSRELLAQLNSKQKQTLKAISVGMYRSTGTHAVFSADPYHFYWLPVIVAQKLAEATAEQRDVLTRIWEILTTPCGERLHKSVRLRAGDALFVNNWVMLHGRRAIAKHSARHLVRAYISS